MATGRTHPALACLIFTGKQHTLKPNGLQIGHLFHVAVSGFHAAKWASQMTPAPNELGLFHETLLFG